MAESFQLPHGTPPATGLGGMGIQQAIGAVEELQEFVTERIADGVAEANAMQVKALDIIEDLKAIPLELELPTLPVAPVLGFDFTFDGAVIAPVTAGDFGEVTHNPVTAPTLADIDTDVDITIPDFVNNTPAFTMPTAPSLAGIGTLPDAPNLDEVQFPTAPTLQFPTAPTLSGIVIPTFNASYLNAIEPTAPEFAGTALESVFSWVEPEYAIEVLDDVKSKLSQMWAGGLGIPPAIENAMWERAMEREDMQLSRELDSALSDFATQGFFTPQGVLIRRADSIREEAALRKSTVSKDITIEVAKIHVENVRFAVTNAIAAENVYLNIHTNMAQRLFEVEKARVELNVTAFNAQVNIFNGKVDLFRAKTQQYTARLQAQIDVFKAELEGELAKGKLDQLQVEIYSAQLQGIQSIVGIYEAQVRAAGVATQAVATKIDSYKASIQAYSETVNAARLPLELFKVQVDAETSKTAFVDADAKAYAALISGKVAQAQVATDIARLSTAKNDTLIKKYEADIELEKSVMLAGVNAIQATVDAYKADVARYSAEVERDTSLAETKMKGEEAVLRLGIANYEAQITAYKAQADIITTRAATNIDAIKAAGSVASTLAAGAMAGINVGASVSGQGSISGSGSSGYQESLSFNQGVTDSRSFS